MMKLLVVGVLTVSLFATVTKHVAGDDLVPDNKLSFSLVDAKTGDELVSPLQSYDLSQTGYALNIRIDSNHEHKLAELRVFVDGVYIKTGKSAPYALFGLKRNGKYKNCHRLTFTNKEHNITAISFDNDGMELVRKTTLFNVTLTAPDISFMLINARTNKDIRPVVDFDIIDLFLTGNRLNLRADIDAKVQFVDFFIGDALIRRESSIFTIGANNGTKYFRFRDFEVPGPLYVGAIAYSDKHHAIAERWIEIVIVDDQNNMEGLVLDDHPLYSIDAGGRGRRFKQQLTDKQFFAAYKSFVYSTTNPIVVPSLYQDIPTQGLISVEEDIVVGKIFQSYRSARGPLIYWLPFGAPIRPVYLRLGFAETKPRVCKKGVGARVMNVAVNDQPFASNLDVLEHVDCYTAYIEEGLVWSDQSGLVIVNITSAGAGTPMISFLQLNDFVPTKGQW